MRIVTVVMALACFAVVSVSMAAPPDRPVRKDRSNLPITIKSNELSTDNKGRTSIFSGKVVAKQGDITIFSDKLIVNYSEKNNEVDRLEAVGNVRIVQLNRTGIASEAVYESRSGRITLTGTPNSKVIQGSDSVSGKTITYYVDEEKSFVTGGGDANSRVEAVINPSARKGDAGGR
jgi:lipopolysaccharide export system protein LptA